MVVVMVMRAVPFLQVPPYPLTYSFRVCVMVYNVPQGMPLPL